MIQRLLIIRRDNIGDLICTTPLFAQLRDTYPQAQIDVLVNSYNYPVVAFNPHLSHAFAYTKYKHRQAGQNFWQVYGQRLKLIWRLKRYRYDAIIVAGNYSTHAERLAKQIGAPIRIGLTAPPPQITTLTHPIQEPTTRSLHEVERTQLLLQALHITPAVYPLTLHADPMRVRHYETVLRPKLTPAQSTPRVLGLHISARKVDQRWSEAHFIELIRRLQAQQRYQIGLFWSPGDENNPHHPGDDQKAQRIMAALPPLAIIPCPTNELTDLIAAMSWCDAVICSDGGAMHVAAGLGKPIVSLFGSSNAQQWHPWGVPHVVLQSASRQVNAISVEAVVMALGQLYPLTTPN